MQTAETKVEGWDDVQRARRKWRARGAWDIRSTRRRGAVATRWSEGSRLRMKEAEQCEERRENKEFDEE